MSVIGSNILAGASGAGAEYTIDQSLRFEDGSSAYLSRTPASTGNRKTWTWSGWVKRGNLVNCHLFDSRSGANLLFLRLESNQLQFARYNSTAFDAQLYTTALFRDPSAWYHVIIAVDTTQSSSSDRMKMYVNGSQITIFGTELYPSQNAEFPINTSSFTAMIGQDQSNSNYLDGYLSEVHFIDGQALDPTSFGEVDATYGHWKPIEYTGTYGTNGFYLDFSNSGSIGEDQAGSNDWTANNLAATDVMLDSPTNNFPILSPLYLNGGGAPASSFSEGNLKVAFTSSGGGHGSSTISMSSGKWYAEFLMTASSSPNAYVGIRLASKVNDSPYSPGNTDGSYGYKENGDKYSSTSSSAYGASWTNGDIIGVAFDSDAGTLTFYKNGSSQGTAFTGISGEFLFAIGDGSTAGTHTQVANFGQDSSFAGNKTAQNNTDDNGYGDFYYSPPSGFLALCTANLSDPAVVPGENFNTVLYTGTGSSLGVTGVGFQPDWVWIKNRSTAANHYLYDAIRGAGNGLYSDLTSAEVFEANQVTSIDADGFSVSTGGATNGSGNALVAWNWKADNTAGSTNTDGSITSTVAANVDAGFSIVAYTGTGSNATVGHGLSSAPEMVIIKNRDAADAWQVYHASNTANPETDYLVLNTTAATADNVNRWNDTLPTSSVFTIGNGVEVNTNTENYIAYCFHSVDGYSKFGSYIGNGSNDGNFVYLGFKPAFIIFKQTNTARSWQMFDNTRNTFNTVKNFLLPNSTDAEADDEGQIDFVSNGFKITLLDNKINQSGGTYIYMAFAESPFKYTTAR